VTDDVGKGESSVVDQSAVTARQRRAATATTAAAAAAADGAGDGGDAELTAGSDAVLDATSSYDL